MGKNARLKKERRSKREAMASEVERWSALPAQALRGPCRSPTCTIPRCLDPWVTRVEIHNVTYDGPLVLVCWSKPEDEGRISKLLRINGEDVGEVPSPGLPQDQYDAHIQALIGAIQRRYGAGSLQAVVLHLAGGADARGQFPGRPLPGPAKA